MSSHWNYRVVAVYKNDSSSYTIRECFYEKLGDVIPYLWSGKSTSYGNSVEELKRDLEMMLLAFNKPVLVEEFDGDGNAVRLVEDK